MNQTSSHDIERMIAENDLRGLNRLLEHPDPAIRLEAAVALIELDQDDGWKAMASALHQADEPKIQIDAAGMLGDLGDPRAIPLLEEALTKITGESENAESAENPVVNALIKALETIGGSEADEALRRAGYEPVLPFKTGAQVTVYEGDYVRSVRPDTSQVEFLTVEQHLANATDLQEADQPERALVEDSLALWLSPDSFDAWYLRGVLFEDLDRTYEAALCYRWAHELDPIQPNPNEALGELEKVGGFSADDSDLALADLAAHSWQERRDAAAHFGDLGESAPALVVDRLLDLVFDDNREVRHAAIEALGNIGDRRAIPPLLKLEENSWLLRFAIIEALAQIGSVSGLVTVLRRMMGRVQERNPLFSYEKDPLLEVEYDRLMEVGVLAFEKAGDLEGLLAFVEGSVKEESEAMSDAAEEEEEENEEPDQVLDAYVDEVALIAGLALERKASPALASLNADILRRLAALPDLVLLDPAQEGGTGPTVVHDRSALREAAGAELSKR